MFRRIVVPVDGSVVAERVIDWVSPLREADGALHLVRVVPGRAEESTAFEQALFVEATSYLEYLTQERGGSLEISVRRGTAATEVLAHARSVGADLIALSAQGASGASRLVFGSVASALVSAAECPVLVAPPSTGGAGTPRDTLERLLVAVDGSPESESVLPPALEIARERGATLVLLHVVEPTWAADTSAASTAQARKVKEVYERLRQVASEATAAGVRALPLIARGDPALEILAQVERRGAGLLCLSTAGRGLAGRLVFGSIAEKVIPKARVPLLLVRRRRADG